MVVCHLHSLNNYILYSMFTSIQHVHIFDRKGCLATDPVDRLLGVLVRLGVGEYLSDVSRYRSR